VGTPTTRGCVLGPVVGCALVTPFRIAPDPGFAVDDFSFDGL
jgi:hypothetical protein